MDTHQLPNSPECKKCGAKLTGQMTTGGRGPQPGDLSICAYCLTVGRFDNEMSIIPLNDTELAAAYVEFPDLEEYINVTREALKEKQKGLN